MLSHRFEHVKTMVLLSYAGEAKNMEEKEKSLTLKPIIPPQTTMTLKRAWKAYKENLENAQFLKKIILGSKCN